MNVPHVLFGPNRLSGQGIEYSVRTPQGFRSQIDDIIGFKSCDFSFSCSCADVQNLIPETLGGDVTAYLHGEEIWEGVVNRVDIEHDGILLSIGPLNEVANRVDLVWDNVTFGTHVPISIGPFAYGWQGDEASIRRFGTLEEIISGGQLDYDQAQSVILIALAELAWPLSIHTPAQTQGQLARVTVSALGYGELTLAKRHYVYDVGAEKIDIGEKIARLVNLAMPGRGALLARKTGYLVEEWVETTRLCSEIINDDLRKIGDRPHVLTFGIYENCTPILQSVREMPFTFNPRTGQLDGPLGAINHPRPGILVNSGEATPYYGTIQTQYGQQAHHHVYVETIEFTPEQGYVVNQGRSSLLKHKLEKEGIG